MISAEQGCPVTTQVHSPNLKQLTIDAQCIPDSRERIKIPFYLSSSIYIVHRELAGLQMYVCVHVDVSVKPFSQSTDYPGLYNKLGTNLSDRVRVGEHYSYNITCGAHICISPPSVSVTTLTPISCLSPGLASSQQAPLSEPE